MICFKQGVLRHIFKMIYSFMYIRREGVIYLYCLFIHFSDNNLKPTPGTGKCAAFQNVMQCSARKCALWFKSFKQTSKGPKQLIAFSISWPESSLLIWCLSVSSTRIIISLHGIRSVWIQRLFGTSTPSKYSWEVRKCLRLCLGVIATFSCYLTTKEPIQDFRNKIDALEDCVTQMNTNGEHKWTKWRTNE